MSLADEIAADIPVCWWPLDAGASDIGSAGLHGAVSGTVRFGARLALEVGGAQFEGGGHIVLPAMELDYSAGLTFEAVVVTLAQSRYQRILDFGIAAGNENLVFANTDISNNIHLSVYQGTDGNRYLVSPGGLPVLSPRHVLVIADPIAHRLAIYVNGKEIASTGFTGTVPSVRRTSNFIGRSNWTADGPLIAMLGQIAVYNRVLSPARIAAHAATLPLTNPATRLGFPGTRYSANVVPASPPGQKGYNPYIGLWDVYDGGHGQVHGKVTTEGAPAHRKVRLLSARDGRILRERWSEQDGRYDFPFIAEDRDYVALAHDHLAQFNAVVADRVRAEPMP